MGKFLKLFPWFYVRILNLLQYLLAFPSIVVVQLNIYSFYVKRALRRQVFFICSFRMCCSCPIVLITHMLYFIMLLPKRELLLRSPYNLDSYCVCLMLQTLYLYLEIVWKSRNISNFAWCLSVYLPQAISSKGNNYYTYNYCYM